MTAQRIRRMIGLAPTIILAAVILTGTPADAMSYVTADTPQISSITKTSATLRCVFHVASGHTAYPWILSYRAGDGAQKSYYVGAAVGGGAHSLTQSRGGLSSGTQYIVRCLASYYQRGPVAAASQKGFTTQPATGTAPAPLHTPGGYTPNEAV